MSEELPEGWELVELGDLISGFESGRNLRSEGRPARKDEYGVLKISAVTWGAFLPNENKALLPGDEPKPHEQIRKNDLLVTRANTSDLVGAVVLVDSDHPNLMLPDKILRLCPNASVVHSGFLLYALRTPAVREHFERNATGTSDSMRNLSQPKLAAAPVPLAPLPEQRRIFAAVEALMTELSATRTRLAKVPFILKRFRQAVVMAACSGRLTNREVVKDELPSTWRWSTISDLLIPGGIFDGARDHGAHTPVALNLRTSDYTDAGVRVIRLENLSHLSFVADKYTYISEEKYASLKQNPVIEGDILFGSFVEDTVRVCLMPRLDTPAITKADCFCIRTQPELVLRDYLVLQLASKRTHDSLMEEVHGATRPRITTKQLRAVRVPLCSMQEQYEIVRRVHALFALADNIERRLAVIIARTEKVPQAILAKAFRGELVPTEAELARAEDRDYDPASVLLERMRKERTAAGPSAGRGRNKAALANGPAKNTRVNAR